MAMYTPLTKSIASYKYDICVITAANNHQAEGYRKQLEWRKEQGLLPKETQFLVYPDPQGKRIGSGGSTIYVLCKLLEHFGCNLTQIDNFYRKKRILILHSGGDSRRLPAYSAVGKIFTPLPTEKFVALFDVLLDNFMQLPYLDPGQVIVTSGDVLLSLDPAYVAFCDTGVTGVAYPDSPDVASNHGVYVVSPNHLEGNPRRVIGFLQKPDYDELHAANALDNTNQAYVDTGIMNFAPDAVETLIKASIVERVVSSLNVDDGLRPTPLYEQILNADIQLDLYEDFTFAMLGKRTRFTTVEQLRKIPFYVNLLPYCDFFHIGRSKDFLRNFYTITHASTMYDFRNFTRLYFKDHTPLKDAYVYNTLIDTDFINVIAPVLIEGCQLGGKIELEGENILTGVPRNAGDIRLQKGICMTVVPIKDDVGELLYKWVPILYGIEDSFKYTVEDERCTFLNTNFSDWMSEHGISPTDLWEDKEPHELWNARLFSFNTDPVESMRISLSLQSDETFQLDKWKASSRMSLKEVLRTIDYERFLKGYSTLNLELSS